MNLRRLHHRIWFPRNVGRMLAEFLADILHVRGGETIGVTHHATKQMRCDPRCLIPYPTWPRLVQRSNTLVEVYEIIEDERPTGVLQKVALRHRPPDERFDFTYLIARDGFVISACANDRGDEHRLVARHNYWCPHGQETALPRREHRPNQGPEHA